MQVRYFPPVRLSKKCENGSSSSKLLEMVLPSTPARDGSLSRGKMMASNHPGKGFTSESRKMIISEAEFFRPAFRAVAGPRGFCLTTFKFSLPLYSASRKSSGFSEPSSASITSTFFPASSGTRASKSARRFASIPRLGTTMLALGFSGM